VPIDVIRCQCKAQGKKCSTEACSCHKELLHSTYKETKHSGGDKEEENFEEAIEMENYDFEETEMAVEDYVDEILWMNPQAPLVTSQSSCLWDSIECDITG